MKFTINTSHFTDEELVAQGGKFVKQLSCRLNSLSLASECNPSTTTLLTSCFGVVSLKEGVQRGVSECLA